MPGPPPTPTAILKVRGSKRAKYNRRNEPQPKKSAPVCPSHLTDAAKAEWKRLAPILVSMGLLSRLDRSTLACYCQAWARWKKAEAEVAKTGEVVKSPRGYPIQNPWLSISNQAQKQMHQHGAELGLSPAARTRVKVESPKERDPLDELLSDAG